VRPRNVGFTHPRPTMTGEHERVFGLVPSFECDRDQLQYHPAVLGLPLAMSNPRLRALLSTYVLELQRHLRDGERASRQVIEHMVQLLPDGRPTLGEVATRIGVSPRTLQGRLRDEGTSFQALLDRVRRDAAMTALRDPTRPLADIALMLGFADQERQKQDGFSHGPSVRETRAGANPDLRSTLGSCRAPGPGPRPG
jgi:AraC-like DNA-binding protein